MKNGFELNPETLHDAHFDKKKEVSLAHEEMEKLQKMLKGINQEIEMKRNFLMEMEKAALKLKQNSPQSPKLRDSEEAIEDCRKEISSMEADEEILVERIAKLFNIHRIHTEALDSIDEKTAIEN